MVDYKSDPVEGLDLGRVLRRALLDAAAVYALAALRSGAERVEVAYVFLERPDEPVSEVLRGGRVNAPGESSPSSRPAY